MSAAAHTPAPWIPEGLGGDRQVIAECAIVCRFPLWEGTEAERDANIALVCAAPELLGAAEAALECILMHVPAHVFAPRERLKAAIAAAKGRSGR